MKSLALAFAFLICASCARANQPSAPPVATTSAEQGAGNEGPNGGTGEAQEVARLSGEMLLIVQRSPTLFRELSLPDLNAAVEKTKLFVVPNIIVDGHELDASNNGVDTINISHDRWLLKTDRLAKIALIFHEYLGILGLEKDNYAISERILNPVAGISSPESYQCDDIYRTQMNFHYDSTSDLYFFEYEGVNETEYLKKYPGSDVGKAETEADSSWSLRFNYQHTAIRKKVGDTIVELGTGTDLNIFRMFHVLDGAGLVFATASGDFQWVCRPTASGPSARQF